MLQISQLFVYPIKSLPGIALSEARVTDRGLEHDRRWMLIDENNTFLSQRELPEMVFFDIRIGEDGLFVSSLKDHSTILIPYQPLKIETVQATVWDDTCTGQLVSDEADAWFSDKLGFPCRLVYMPDDSHRLVEEKYRIDQNVTSFSDGYPFLIIGQTSMDDLNERMGITLPITNFRPNIVFTGGEANVEDEMAHFKVGGVHFYGVKLCARCPVPTIDQATGIRGKEPIKTLATYRRRNNKVVFGQNLLHKGEGVLRIGDLIEVKKLKEQVVFA